MFPHISWCLCCRHGKPNFSLPILDIARLEAKTVTKCRWNHDKANGREGLGWSAPRLRNSCAAGGGALISGKFCPYVFMCMANGMVVRGAPKCSIRMGNPT